MSVVLLLLVLGLVTSFAESREDASFVLVAPKRLLPGSSESICLVLFNSSEFNTIHLRIDLLQIDLDHLLATQRVKVTKDKLHEQPICTSLAIPPTTEERARLRLRVRWGDVPDEEETLIREVALQGGATVLPFVETDRPAYRGGQEVRIRLLTLKHDLHVVQEPIPEVWLENPEGVRVAQWKNVETSSGLAQLSYNLTSEPVLGRWHIRMRPPLAPLLPPHSQAFLVEDYQLPRFEVTLHPPHYLLRSDKEVVWRVCAKYTHGQPVRGKVAARTQEQLPNWVFQLREGTGREVAYAGELGEDGCMVVRVSASDMGIQRWPHPDALNLTAQITEEGTGATEGGWISLPFADEARKLSFFPGTPRYFKPGIPFVGQLAVTFPDGTPAAYEEVELCLRKSSKGWQERDKVGCSNATSDEKGIISFAVPPHTGMRLLQIIARIVQSADDQTPLQSRRIPTAILSARAWFSPSDTSLQFLPVPGLLKCDTKETLKLFVAGEITTSQQLYIMVQSRGDIVDQRSMLLSSNLKSVDLPKLLPPETTILKWNEIEEGLESASLDDMAVLTADIELHINPSTSPMARVLAFIVRDDKELVAESTELRVEHCYENKVSLHWSSSKLHPGNRVLLTVKAAPNSLCGLSVLDRNAALLAKARGVQHHLTDAQLTGKLSVFEISPDSHPMQSSGHDHCKNKDFDDWPFPSAIPLDEDMRRRKRSYRWRGLGSDFVDAAQAFDEFGAAVLTDLTYETRPCTRRAVAAPLAVSMYMPLSRSPPAHSPSTVQRISVLEYDYDVMPDSANFSPHTPRSFFPESWLWQLVSVGEIGKLIMKRDAPHSVTTWEATAVCASMSAGIGLAPPENLLVSQPFFLDLIIPPVAHRGETLQVRAMLFNLQSYALPVRVNVQLEEGIHLMVPLDSSAVSWCVRAHQSHVFSFQLVPSKLGDVNVTVKAQLDDMFPQECGPESVESVQDSVRKTLTVQPEGFPVDKARSTLLCPQGDESTETEFPLPLPDSIVEGSARTWLDISGDLMGPSLQNLDKLVIQPTGCGEQNMVLLAPNVFVLRYLHATSQSSEWIRTKAAKHMETGYQRQLKYRHPDSSFSAFGAQDDSGSLWLTAFVVRVFAQAKQYIFIDHSALQQSIKWIATQQMENGCFRPTGLVLHKAMKGGIGSDGDIDGDDKSGAPTALTAYVVAALLEAIGEGEKDKTALQAVQNAMFCLQATPPTDTYAQALYAYALALSPPSDEKHTEAKRAIKRLLTMASRDQGLLWWESDGPQNQALNVETTGYGVLALSTLGLTLDKEGWSTGGSDKVPEREVWVETARAAIHWLAQQRNAHGGFVSTQDTVVALQALASFATWLPPSSPSLQISLSFNNEGWMREIDISEENRLVSHRRLLSALISSVKVKASGKGCAVASVSQRYNLQRSSPSNSFELDISLSPTKNNDYCGPQLLTVCFRYNAADGDSNMAVLDIELPTGLETDVSSIQALENEVSLGFKRWELPKGHIILYFDSVSHQKRCLSIQLQRVVLVKDARPATAIIWDYYNSEKRAEVEYAAPPSCDVEPLPELPDEGEVIVSKQSNVEGSRAEAVEDVATKTKKYRTGEDDDEPALKGPFTAVPLERDPESVLLDILPYIEEGHLNPDFVDVPHELDVPDGMEGPVPRVKRPDPLMRPMGDQASGRRRGSSIRRKQPVHMTTQFNQTSGCPRCFRRPPQWLPQFLCDSRSLVKGVAKGEKTALLVLKIVMAESRRPSPLNSTVTIELQEKCSCQPLQIPKAHFLVLDPPQNVLSNRANKMRIGPSSIIVGVFKSRGMPSIVRQSVRSCQKKQK